MDISTEAFAKISPKGMADKVLNTYWDKKFPVNPIAIAKALSIKVYEDVSLQKSGMLRKEKGSNNLAIYVCDRRKEPIERMRFTIAHELGHYVLGHGPSNRESGYDPNWGTNEIAANDFAAELLMPEKYVRLYALEKCYSFQKLTEIFQVSKMALSIRLRELGIIF